MSKDSTMVIVADGACDACGTRQPVVHHESFPAMLVRGVSVEDAAKNLATKLESNLDAVSDPMHRKPVQLAIDDVHAFIDEETGSPSQPKHCDIINVGSGSASTSSKLVATETLEVRRLTLAKGREIPTHHARGEIVVHCLEGQIAFTTGGTTRNVSAGQLIVLAAGEPHSLVGLEESTVLVTKNLLVRPSVA